MATNIGNPINSPENFSIQKQAPIDERMWHATLSARDAIPTSIRHTGMEVYIENPAGNGTVPPQKYILTGGITNDDWVQLPIDGSGGGGGGSLGSLSDVTITNPSVNDELKYNSGVWVNTASSFSKSGSNVVLTNGNDIVTLGAVIDSDFKFNVEGKVRAFSGITLGNKSVQNSASTLLAINATAPAPVIEARYNTTELLQLNNDSLRLFNRNFAFLNAQDKVNLYASSVNAGTGENFTVTADNLVVNGDLAFGKNETNVSSIFSPVVNGQTAVGFKNSHLVDINSIASGARVIDTAINPLINYTSASTNAKLTVLNVGYNYNTGTGITDPYNGVEALRVNNGDVVLVDPATRFAVGLDNPNGQFSLRYDVSRDAHTYIIDVTNTLNETLFRMGKDGTTTFGKDMHVNADIYANNIHADNITFDSSAFANISVGFITNTTTSTHYYYQIAVIDTGEDHNTCVMDYSTIGTGYYYTGELKGYLNCVTGDINITEYYENEARGTHNNIYFTVIKSQNPDGTWKFILYKRAEANGRIKFAVESSVGWDVSKENDIYLIHYTNLPEGEVTVVPSVWIAGQPTDVPPQEDVLWKAKTMPSGNVVIHNDPQDDRVVIGSTIVAPAHEFDDTTLHVHKGLSTSRINIVSTDFEQPDTFEVIHHGNNLLNVYNFGYDSTVPLFSFDLPNDRLFTSLPINSSSGQSAFNSAIVNHEFTGLGDSLLYRLTKVGTHSTPTQGDLLTWDAALGEYTPRTLVLYDYSEDIHWERNSVTNAISPKEDGDRVRIGVGSPEGALPSTESNLIVYGEAFVETALEIGYIRLSEGAHPDALDITGRTRAADLHMYALHAEASVNTPYVAATNLITTPALTALSGTIRDLTAVGDCVISADSTSISNLTSVGFNTPVDGQVLTWIEAQGKYLPKTPEAGSAGDPTLGRSFTTTVAVGGIDVGTTFGSNTLIAVILEQMLAPYVPAELTNLSMQITPSGNKFEIGQSVTLAGAVWSSTIGSDNQPVVDIEFIGATEFTNDPYNGGTAPVDPGSETLLMPATRQKTWYIKGRDSKGSFVPQISSITYKWEGPVWFGGSAIVPTSSTVGDLIDDLSQKGLGERITLNFYGDSSTEDASKNTYIVRQYALSDVVLNGNSSVFGAFTLIGQWGYTTEYGYAMGVRVYKSNATGAFSSADTLTIS